MTWLHLVGPTHAPRRDRGAFECQHVHPATWPPALTHGLKYTSQVVTKRAYMIVSIACAIARPCNTWPGIQTNPKHHKDKLTVLARQLLSLRPFSCDALLSVHTNAYMRACMHTYSHTYICCHRSPSALPTNSAPQKQGDVLTHMFSVLGFDSMCCAQPFTAGYPPWVWVCV